ncbi:hypothetical protein IT570_14470 [Candidatus Sumerlaeota bacterium]|nr:hypothetical protein [Candidatus Sumerlaeota bacterium]
MKSRTQTSLQKKKLIAAALLLAGITGSAGAATFTSSATGDWDQLTTWTVVGVDGDGVPDADDDVTINGTFTVTIDAPAACASLTVAAVNALNINDQTLTVENDVINNGTMSSGGAGTLVVGNDGTGNLTNGGSFSLSGCTITVNGDVSNTLSFSISGSTMAVDGDLSNSSFLIFTAGTVTVDGDVTNTSGGTFTGDSGGTLNLLGDISMGGLVTIFNFNCVGTALQTISGGSTSVVITNMTVDNTSNVDLNRPLVVGSFGGATLTLTNGQVLTTDTDLLILRTPQDATVGTLTRTNGYVNPVFARDVNATLLSGYLFPVGTGLGYTPASVTFTDAFDAGSGIRVHVHDGDQPNVALNAPDPDLALDRYWNLVTLNIPGSPAGSPGSYAADLSLTYLDGDIDALSLTPPQAEANFRVARDKVAPLKYQTYATTVNTGTNTATGQPYVQNGDYTLVQQLPSDPLAVDLTSFTAASQGAGEHVSLSWTTAGEFNNAGFNIYYADGNNKGAKVNASIIPAQGSEFSGHTYEFEDHNVLVAGEVRGYYLEDVDAASVATLHGPAVVAADGNSASEAVLDNLTLVNWESGAATPTFVAPTFSNDASGLGEAIPNGADSVFGFWQTRLPLAPLPAGTYKLTVHLEWNKTTGVQAPDVRLRVFEADNAKNSMTHTVDRTSAGKQLPEEVSAVWTSDGTSEWRVAVDLLGFASPQAGSFKVVHVMNEPYNVP